MGENIFTVNSLVDCNERRELFKLEPKVIWMSGLSGSGKSTIAYSLEKVLISKGVLTSVLDGDNLRTGLCSDLGFSEKDRDENIRRVAEVAKLLSDSGVVVIVSLISPLEKHRDLAREIIGERFNEVFINASLEICIKRDVKGLYRKAINGEIEEFTGISSPYEIPKSPRVVIDTSTSSIKDSVDTLLSLVSPIY
jgi:adenylylsulfate kinase